jgi:thiol-disulfide isomerase/thioredoxin
MKWKKILLIVGFLLCMVSVFSQEIGKIKVTRLDSLVKNSTGPLIVNFWATYCKPCIEEMPYFQALSKKHGVDLLLVSLDLYDFYPDKIKKFVERMNVTAPVIWLDESDADYFCAVVDSAWSGAIPASLFVNNSMGYRRFIEDELTEQELEKIILELLGRKE